MRRTLLNSFALCFIASSIAAPSVLAVEDGSTTSMDAMSSTGHTTGESVALTADYELHQGNIDKAIRLCRRALSKNPDDLDTHQVYAEALEKKLRKQSERDPDLYNECVKEWLIVLRNRVGDEKGLNFHGVGILGHFYEDDERGVPARQHLVTLTGYAPKMWETDAKYLKRVCKPTGTEVKGVVKDKGKDKDQDDASDDQSDQMNSAIHLPPGTQSPAKDQD